MSKTTRVIALTLIVALATVWLYFTLAPYVGRPTYVCASPDPPPDLNLPLVPPALSNGEPAPRFNATDINGGPVDLADLRGRVIVMNFMGTWCQSCVWEAGRLVEVYTTYRDQGLEMLSISVEPDRSTESIREFRSEYCAEWRFVLGDGALMSLYSVENLPTTYVIDRSGRIAYGHVGLISVQDVSGEIERLLTG